MGHFQGFLEDLQGPPEGLKLETLFWVRNQTKQSNTPTKTVEHTAMVPPWYTRHPPTRMGGECCSALYEASRWRRADNRDGREGEAEEAGHHRRQVGVNTCHGTAHQWRWAAFNAPEIKQINQTWQTK